VAVVFCDHIGGFVAASPLMRGLRERYPDVVLDYVGGERTVELETASPLIDARFSLFGMDDPLSEMTRFFEERRQQAGPYALVVNLEAEEIAAQASGLTGATYVVGNAIDPGSGAHVPHAAEPIDGLWHDTWNRADLLEDYPELTSQYIGELFCRLARVESDYVRTEAPQAPPPISIPPVLLSTGGNRSARLWPTAHWVKLVRHLGGRGVEAGLLGAAPAVQEARYHTADADEAIVRAGAKDLRGQLTLPEVAGALARVRAFVTVDNGLMHIAAAVGAPTIALLGASPGRIWAPRTPCVRIVEPAEPCTLCEENRFRNPDCLLPRHQCMESIAPTRVLAALAEILPDA
jgi:ADP-heptose:LPS heptosyltransferase